MDALKDSIGLAQSAVRKKWSAYVEWQVRYRFSNVFPRGIRNMKLANLGTVLLILAAAQFNAPSQAAADWILISDFTGLTDPAKVSGGAKGGWLLNGQGNWTTGVAGNAANTDAFTTQDTSAPGGLHMGVGPLVSGNTTTNRRWARISLPTAARIANNATGTLFFRFFADSGDTFAKVQVGLSPQDVTAPNHMNMAFRVQEGSNSIFYGTDINSSATSDTHKARGVWHNVWFVVNNATDKIDMYMTTGNQDATSATPILSQGNFGASVTATLQTLILVTNSPSTNPSEIRFRFDDFYMASGTDLTSPVPIPEPATGALLGGCLAALAAFRRRRAA